MIIEGQSYGANGSAARAPAASLTSDFNTFLRMLTVQMQNQDPLNPLSASDFAVQLATFSQVEQQVRANDLLTALGSQIAELGLSQLASWIGLEARISAPVTRTERPIELSFSPDPLADQAKILVRDMTGREVQSLPVTPQLRSLKWTADGLPSGTYQLELVNYSAGMAISTGPVEHFARVQEAGASNGGVMLTVDTGTSLAASAVSGFRAPRN